MKTQKDTPKPHWLDGDRQRLQSDDVRGAAAAGGLNLSGPEAEEAADKIRLYRMGQDACNPEVVLAHGGKCIAYIKEKVVNPHRRLDPAFREILRRYFIKKRGLTANDADRECDAVEVRERPTLRCMRDAWSWLHNAGYALRSGRNFVTEAKTAKDEDARKAALIQAEEEFARAVSLAYYAGVECGELKARASFDEKFGGDEKSRRKGKHTVGFEPTRSAWRALKEGAEEPKADSLLLWMEKTGALQFEEQPVRLPGARSGKERTGRIRYKNPRGGWSRWVTEASFRNNLTSWKKEFTV